MKKYRVDAFVAGRHTKKLFYREADARKYGEKQQCKGEIVFLLKRLNEKTFDVIEVLS